MRRTLKLQDPGEGVHEVEIREVLVSEGKTVSEGDDVLVVESDKAAVEIPAPYDGTVESIEVSEGDVVEVGSVLMTFDTGDDAEDGAPTGSGIDDADDRPEGEETEDVRETAERKEKEGKIDGDGEEDEDDGEARKADAEEAAGNHGGDEPAEPTEQSRPVPATPAVRRLAREIGIDLREIEGGGEDGRVTEQDVRAHAGPADEASTEEREKKQTSLPDFSRWGPVERTPLRSVRRQIARAMTAAWHEIPHVTHCDVADVTDLESFRRQNADSVTRDGSKLTPLVLVIKAVVAALKDFPRLNASLDAEAGQLIMKDYFHIGVATDTERGLLVPVVRNVDRKSLTELAAEIMGLVDRARAGDLRREEMQGGTFTVTNAGSIGATYFTPIINWPEAAILGLGTIRTEAVIRGTPDDFDVTARLHLPLSLSFDHRIADGAQAARFVNRIKEMIEDPDNFVVST